MNRLLLLVVGVVFSLWLAYSVFTSSGNSLGQMAKWLMIAGLLMGVFAPKGAMLLFFISCGYSDMLKRLLVVDGRFGGIDIIFILAIAPAILLGLALNWLFGIMSGSYRPTKLDYILFGSAVLFNVFTGFSAIAQGYGPLVAAQSVATVSCSAVLLFVIPALFPTREKFLKSVRFLTYAFLPCLFYGILQRYLGIAEFERVYLESGFTVNREALEYLKSGGQPRPFSTLNHHATFGLVCAIVGLLIFLSIYRPRDGDPSLRNLPFTRNWGLFLGTLYLMGTFHSFARTTWAIAVMAVLFAVLFRRSYLVLYGYASIFIPLLILMASSEMIVEERLLDSLQDELVQTFDLEAGSSLDQAIRVTTYAARIEGFATLFGNANAWTLFGMDKDDMEYFMDNEGTSHDMITHTLLRFGAVTLFGGLIVVAFIAYRVHRTVLRVPDRHELGRLCLLLGLPVAMLVGNATSGNLTTVFPISHLFFYNLAGVIIFAVHGLAGAKQDEKEGRTASPRKREPYVPLAVRGPAPSVAADREAPTIRT